MNSDNINNEFDILCKETLRKFYKMTDLERKYYIINIKNDESINKVLRKKLLSFYVCIYKICNWN